MTDRSACWLIVNPSSGSNAGGEAVDGEPIDVATMLNERAWIVTRKVTFPCDPLPPMQTLDEESIRLAVVHAGDGTVSAVLNHLQDWDGQVLVLPGGTMNLLSRRLHGNATTREILDIVAAGRSRAHRISALAHEHGIAFAELLAGPGTCWHEVRESMRDGAVTDIATNAVEALRQTTERPHVWPRGMSLAREAGYKLVAIVPGEWGLRVDGYFAEDAIDFAAQAWQTVRRQFREGPHDRLGLSDRITLTTMDNSPLPCLADGEPVECADGYEFTAIEPQVELVATGHD
ncbi:MAG: acylglycerol kinase family protein [Erythrobacter sp.]